jgi:hypothetical protein
MLDGCVLEEDSLTDITETIGLRVRARVRCYQV